MLIRGIIIIVTFSLGFLFGLVWFALGGANDGNK